MKICEDSSSSSSGMDFYEDDIKIEEISVEDEDYSDNPCDSTSFVSGSRNMIFTQIYVPQERGMQGILASSAMDMELKNRPGRKQKLEHLSFEEKLLRKKLKNREAAQTSRDRKKARMTDLEIQVQYLQEQNERLRCEKENVCKENERLKRELTTNPPAAVVTHPPSIPAPRSTTQVLSLPPCLSSSVLSKPNVHRAGTQDDQITPCAGTEDDQQVTSSVPAAPLISLNAIPATTGEASRVAPSIGQESAEFLELSPQQTPDLMQDATRSASPTAATIAHKLGQEVLVMVSTVASLLLAIALTTVSGPPPTGTGSLTLTRDHLQSAFSSLSISQQDYLNQLLLIIAKELNQVPRWWGTEQRAWNPVHFLHSNVPLFLQHLPPVPPKPPSAPPRRPSLSDLVEATMRRVPVPC